MVPKLNHDCFQIVFEFLESDQHALFKCIQVNRSWFEILVPYLWENPFSIVHRRGAANSKKLLKTIISMFPFDMGTEQKLNSCKYYKVTYHDHGQSFCDYLSFMKIFKSIEFHGFIDKCSRVTPWKYKPFKKRYNDTDKKWVTKPNEYDESLISSTLTQHVYNIIFKNCTKIRQFMLMNISNATIQNNSFNNFSNLCYLEVSKILYLGRIFPACKRIKKIVVHFKINPQGSFFDSFLLIDFLKNQRELKAVHFINRFNNRLGYISHLNMPRSTIPQIPEELLIQMRSIEEFSMDGFMLPYKQLNTLSKLKHLEITLMEWPSQIVATFRNVLCPLLEVLKFQDDLPPLDVLAEFIENTKGHLQCFYIKHLNQHKYCDTQLLLKSITKSCPKINSLSIVINITEDLSFLENLLISCNELKNFTLMSTDRMNPTLLQKHLRIIDENWDVIQEKCQYRMSAEWIRFNRYRIK